MTNAPATPAPPAPAGDEHKRKWWQGGGDRNVSPEPDPAREAPRSWWAAALEWVGELDWDFDD